MLMALFNQISNEKYFVKRLIYVKQTAIILINQRITNKKLFIFFRSTDV